ncbi:hypothetical protein M3Y94_00242500 [Aphelenchoides besseyi]|nr:hypothetical protein M3Y94_00242500 [Aphelenchoides besseyi]KAI6236335.1 hypothetical protein M3Y95_00146500 [Aphelenchoides besseyi]
MENQQYRVVSDSELQYEDIVPISAVGELVFENPETVDDLSPTEEQCESATQESNNETSNGYSLNTNEEQKQRESVLMEKLKGLYKIKKFQMSQQKLKYKMAIKMQSKISKLEKRIKELANENATYKQKIQQCHRSTAIQEYNQQVADEEQINQLNTRIEDLENECCDLQKHNVEQKIQNNEIMNGNLRLSSESSYSPTSSPEDSQQFEFFLGNTFS